MGGVQLVVVLPRLGDHHQDGVVDRAATEVEQLEDLVEARRVRGTRRADREGPIDAREDRAVEHRLAGAHPVLVALDRVDLAVVGDEAVRVGERPGRERVGREATVDEQQRALEPLVVQIREELPELRCRQHPLVDERARRQRREVRGDLRFQLVLDALAHEVHLAVELDPRGSRRVGNEDLGERRHHGPRRGAEAARIDRDVAPRHHVERLVGGDRLDRRAGLLGGEGVVRVEADADGVRARWREVDSLLVVEHPSQEAVRDLDQDSRAVARVRLGAGGTTVGEVRQGPESRGDELVARHALDVGHEGDAARVVLESRVVEPRRAWLGLHRLHIHGSRGTAWVDVRDDAGPNGLGSVAVATASRK